MTSLEERCFLSNVEKLRLLTIHSSSSSIYWYETYLHVYNHNNNIITNYNMITNNK